MERQHQGTGHGQLPLLTFQHPAHQGPGALFELGGHQLGLGLDLRQPLGEHPVHAVVLPSGRSMAGMHVKHPAPAHQDGKGPAQRGGTRILQDAGNGQLPQRHPPRLDGAMEHQQKRGRMPALIQCQRLLRQGASVIGCLGHPDHQVRPSPGCLRLVNALHRDAFNPALAQHRSQLFLLAQRRID